MMRTALVACFALAASALSPSGEGASIFDEAGLLDEEGALRETEGALIQDEGALQEAEGDLIEGDSQTSSFDKFVDDHFGDGGELADGVNLGDLLGEIEQYRPKKRKNRTRLRKPWETDNRTAALNVIIPLLQEDFKQKTTELKGALRNFKEHQKALDFAKKDATLAMKELRKEAERRRKVILDRKKLKEEERMAVVNAKRLAKEAMVKKAQTLVAAHGGYAGEFGALTSEYTLGILVDVLMSLPKAVENPLFNNRLSKAKVNIAATVQDFLNITRRKTTKFVLASSKASDVELAFLMTRYFHEASFRVRSMAADAEKVARDINVVMPKELRTAFFPIIKQMRSQAIPLKMNASSLATADQATACSQISGLMTNITTYNVKLASMHTSLHEVWQLSELMLPHLSKVYPITPEVIDLVKDFMSLATTQVSALQEAADTIATEVGPVISERMQCTWDSAANQRLGLGLLAGLAALAAHALA